MDKALVSFLNQNFSETSSHFTLEKVKSGMIAHWDLYLPNKIRQVCEQGIQSLWSLRRQDKYVDLIMGSTASFKPKNYSAFMSYDFHILDNRPKLIEINTNASFSTLSLILGKQELSVDHYHALRVMIEEEWSYFSSRPLKKILIVDDSPEAQPAYFEFLILKKLFISWGWETKIWDAHKKYEDDVDFIYNRCTDFYLKEDNHQWIKRLYKSGAVCLSPNPHEYALLADKSRLAQWSQDRFLSLFSLSSEEKERIKGISLKSEVFDVQKKEDYWKNRKSLFFKPLKSFGTRGVYRGESISRDIFLQLDEKYLVQEFVSAPNAGEYNSKIKDKNWKFDLRAFVYKGRAFSWCARIYKGQVTNRKEPGGGFSSVHFV